MPAILYRKLMVIIPIPFATSDKKAPVGAPIDALTMGKIPSSYINGCYEFSQQKVAFGALAWQAGMI